jgi:uncharacterized phage protein (TIGR02218 family)
MKVLTTAMQTYLKTGANDLQDFWILTRKDGVHLSLTTYDHDVGAFKSTAGWSRSAVQERSDLAAPNQEVSGIVLDDFVTAEDVRGGKYEGAKLQHFLAVPTDPDFLTYGRIYLPCKYVGEIRLEDGMYYLEVRGFVYLLQQNLIDLFGPLCRANFADKNTQNKCKIDPALWTFNGSVLVPDTAYQSGFNMFTYSHSSGTPADNWKFGTVFWDTGLNEGLSMEIAEIDIGTSTIELYLSMPLPIHAGDQFHAVAGCAKTASACHFYDNIVNMRAEPWIPGINLIFDYGVSS